MARSVRCPPPPLRPDRIGELLTEAGRHLLEFQKPEYTLLHYDDLRFRKLPQGLDLDSAWHLLKFQRFSHLRPLPLRSKDGQPFTYRIPPQIEELVHRIDSLGGQWFESRPADDEEGRRFVRSALIEEAIASSLIEGVATTREVAREMLVTGRAPRNESEIAVVNNLSAMEFVLGHRDEPLTVDLIQRLHATLSQGWLEDQKCGVLRTSDDVVVWDHVRGDVAHRPPSHKLLGERLDKLCDFANEDHSRFLHPLVRATALHFAIGYEHPFCDGNGRTARALFHWSMLRDGFRMYEYLPVSRKILRASAQYPRAFQLVETDEFDLTYFLQFQLTTVLGTLQEAHDYLSRKRREHREFVHRVRRSADFNYRQQALLIRSLNKPESIFTVRSHANSHRVTRQTARSDLAGLEEAELLRSWIDGKTCHWQPVDGIRQKLLERMPQKSRRR